MKRGGSKPFGIGQVAVMTIASIAAVLGGNSVLRRRVNTPQELVALTRDGLPSEALDQLAEQMQLSRAVVARALGISDRTLSRRLHAEAKLTAAESDRAVRMARILAQARETLRRRSMRRNG